MLNCVQSVTEMCVNDGCHFNCNCVIKVLRFDCCLVLKLRWSTDSFQQLKENYDIRYELVCYEVFALIYCSVK
jgi:hypothetical protein